MSVEPAQVEPTQVEILMSNRDYVTGIETCEFRYTWTIKNFSQHSIQSSVSPVFSSRYSDFDDKWILKNNSRDTDWKNSSQIVFSLVQLQSFDDSRLLKKFRVLFHGKKEISKEYDYEKFQEQKRLFFFIRKSELFQTSSECLENDKLKMSCTITMSKKIPNKPVHTNPAFNATQQLMSDLEKFLLNEKSADVTIKVGQKSFRAIKGVLGARSPVFFAMFNHEEFEENKNSEVVIEDIEEDVFEEFLHFIYTGESPNINKMPMELLAVAEKYQVDYLKNICEKVICETIDVDSIASLLVFSDRYNLKKLNEKCLEFMKKNLQDVIADKTFQFYKKKYSEIFVDILENLLLS